jgi:hypothetical protein
MLGWVWGAVRVRVKGEVNLKGQGDRGGLGIGAVGKMLNRLDAVDRSSPRSSRFCPQPLAKARIVQVEKLRHSIVPGGSKDT